MPRVSVIIPAYNAAEVLPEALRSVEAQTYVDWEVVVCDDASHDDTADVAERFGERFRVIRSKENTGPAGARNKALAAARGEFIALLDADDFWLPDFLTEQLALYESSEAAEPGVGIVTCDALILGPQGYAPETFRDRIPFPKRPTLAKLLAANTIYGAVLMPRSIAEEVGGFAPECFGTEDYELWVKVLERGYRPVSNTKALAVYRVQEGSASGDPSRAARNWQKVHLLALQRGRLGRRERWIARRELRVYRLVEDIHEIQSRRATEGHPPIARMVRAAPRAVAVLLENPQRWFQVGGRLLRMKGPLTQRLSPGRDSNLL